MAKANVPERAYKSEAISKAVWADNAKVGQQYAEICIQYSRVAEIMVIAQSASRKVTAEHFWRYHADADGIKLAYLKFVWHNRKDSND